MAQKNHQSDHQSRDVTSPTPSHLPFPLQDSNHAELITQGAEALLYRTIYLLPTIPCALKYRPRKPYRHPTLDARLTRHRVLSEARVLVKCRREGVLVPAVYFVDWEGGWLMMEWIEGSSVRDVLRAWLAPGSTEDDRRVTDNLKENLHGLMKKIGKAVGGMHAIGVIHGDLTTSNLMLRPVSLADEVVLIDFGLAAQSLQDEDRAVDLYVLERAFGSTHPKAEGLFQGVLKAYGESYRGAAMVLRRLEDVRLRGRKKSMIG